MTIGFRVRPVMTTSIRLHINYQITTLLIYHILGETASLKGRIFQKKITAFVSSGHHQAASAALATAQRPRQVPAPKTSPSAQDKSQHPRQVPALPARPGAPGRKLPPVRCGAEKQKPKPFRQKIEKYPKGGHTIDIVKNHNLW